MTWKALIVGLGNIGLGYDLDIPSRSFVLSHAKAMSMHPKFDLVGAVEPSSRQGEIFKEKFSAPTFQTLKEALAVVNPDVIVLATPTSNHFVTLTNILTHCSPNAILCEKPLAFSFDDARKMVDICFKQGVYLYVNYMRRSEPGVLEVKRRFDCGDIIGPIKGVAWYSKGFLHNGSHFFNILGYWLGQMLDFKLLKNGRDLMDGDAELDVHVVFEGGEVMFLAANDDNFSHNSIELIAANGRLRYENGGRRIEWSDAVVDANLKNYTFLADPTEIPSDFNRYQWHVIEQLANTLGGKKAHLCTGEEGLQTLEAMHLILRGRT
ncbi:Gfo/Idh/MocA family oxidoreductase [Alphaproteobacteria bacterium]|nr:Gfo/Idh/MocA family oxidoreductase [Alphaproteobacteria bacterium]